jgi:minor histocompatibility antigen H13
MAEVEIPTVESVTESMPAGDFNDTEPAINGTTGKIPATPEGLALAYSSLVIMALLPIFFGAFRSVKSQADVKENSATTGEKPEIMSQRDAAMFPLIASCALFGLYLFFQFFSKEHINLLLSVYFFVLGIFALSHMISPRVKKMLVPITIIPNENYHLEFLSGEGEDRYY